MRKINPHSKLVLFRVSDEDFSGFCSGFLVLVAIEEESLNALYIVNDCLSISCLKCHDCLRKVSLIKLNTVWRGEKTKNVQKIVTKTVHYINLNV